MVLRSGVSKREDHDRKKSLGMKEKGWWLASLATDIILYK
jgi:hypothetical protein